MFNAIKIEEMQKNKYLNTSHVNVQFSIFCGFFFKWVNLNTSHVNVQFFKMAKFKLGQEDLNTSHVNVQ